jgi:hypothetical protein
MKMGLKVVPLQQRVASLRAERDQHVANANATNGAIQALEEVIRILEAPEAPEAENEEEKVVDLRPGA